MTSPLQQELKQPKPFRSREAEAFLNVLRTSAILLDELAEVLRPFDLTQPQYNVLRILRGAGDAGLTRGEVGERMISRDPDVTRLIDRMEARGMLTRSRGSADRRVVQVRITNAGQKLVDGLDGAIQEMHARQLSQLTSDEVSELCALLVKARTR